MAGGIGFRTATDRLNVYLQKKPVELREHFDNISTRLDGWRMSGEVRKLSKDMIEELGSDLYLDREYVREREGETPRKINVHIVYYTGMIDAVPHVPDRCFVAGGLETRVLPENYPLDLDHARWRPDPDHVNRVTGEPYRLAPYRDPITGRSTVVRMPVGDIVLRTTEFFAPETPGLRVFAGYFFIANGRTACTPEEVKLLAFRKSEEYAYYCKVQFSCGGGREFEAEEFTSLVTDLLEPLLPELMRCLPDWAEVETRMAPASAGSDS